MAYSSGEAEQSESTSGKDWIRRAKLGAEGLRILKNQAGGKLSPRDESLAIRKHLDSNSDWCRKANKYISLKSHNNNTNLYLNVAAKLAVSQSNPEEKLITAIELARSGFIKSSLAAASEIAKQKELSRDDRLDAFMATVENITENKLIFEEGSTGRDPNREWLYASKLTQKIIKTLDLILDLYQNEEELDKLWMSIEEIINSEECKAPTKGKTTEEIALNLANKRNLMIQELAKSYEKPVIRSIHHLACTGGTLISKCLASMPDVALISEVNPMNRFDCKFTPTNTLLLLERSFRTLTTQEKINIFKEQIAHAMRLCEKDDVDLILRDHSHTDFCRGSKESDTCAIKDHLSEDYHLINVLTVRHPLDSYLSLIENGWIHFQPSGIHEYSRRYLAFLDKYSPSEIIRYEDFCRNPQEVMKKICNILRIGFDEEFLNTFGENILSGDSGRSGTKTIEKRSRRPIPTEIISQLENSEYYSRLINILNY